MPSAPKQIEFVFGQLHSEVEDSSEYWQLLLNIGADFSVRIRDRVFYQEPDFPLVEFAAQALRWRREQERDFLYTSMESEEKPLIGFYQMNDQFRIYSPHQEFESTSTIDRDALLKAVSVFTQELRSRSRSELALDLDLELLSERVL